MPLFRKSASEVSALSERYHKALSRCRLLLLKEADSPELLEALAQDEGFKADVRDQIAGQATREQRMATLLDRLEAKGDRPFVVFLDALKDHYRHLHSVLEETLRGIDDFDDTSHRDRIQVPGTLVRKIVRHSSRRKAEASMAGNESADELELIYEDREEEAYLDCYAIPLKGRTAREPWIKYETDIVPDSPEDPGTFMATLIQDTYFKRLDLKDLPNDVQKPPRHCEIYITDPDQTHHVTMRKRNENSFSEKSKKRVSGFTVPAEVILDNGDSNSTEDPPPVPPKPGFLPPLSPRPPILKTRPEVHPADKPPVKLPKPKVLVSENGMVVRAPSDEEGHSEGEGEESEESYGLTPELPPRNHQMSLEGSAGEVDSVDNAPLTNGHLPEEVPAKEEPSQEEETPPALPPREGRRSLPRGTPPSSVAPGNQDTKEEAGVTQGDKDSAPPLVNGENIDHNHSAEHIPAEKCPDKSLPEVGPCVPNGAASQHSAGSPIVNGVATEHEAVGGDTSPGQPEPPDCQPPPVPSGDSSMEGEVYGEAAQVDTESQYEPISPNGECPVTNNKDAAPVPPPIATSDDPTGPLSPVAVASPCSPHSMLDVVDDTVDEAELEMEVPCELYSYQPAVRPGGSPTDEADTAASHAPPAAEDDKTVPFLQLPSRQRRSMRRRGLPSIPRAADPMHLCPQYSSDDDSYYEDIDQFDTSSPSARSQVSYLDPKAHARQVEQALLAEGHVNASWRRRAAALAESLQREERILLRQGELLVTSHTATECATAADIPSAVNTPVSASTPVDSTPQPEGATSEKSSEEPSHQWEDTCLLLDKLSRAFYVHRHLFKQHGDPDGEMWFYPVEISSRQATLFLSETRQEGCFLVYRPMGQSNEVVYNLSVCRANGDVLHYRILRNAHGDVMLANHDHSFMNVADLVRYFQGNKGRLATRLRRPLREAHLAITPGHHYDLRWELERSALSLSGKIIGKGQYGMVCGGLYRGLAVAVKVMAKSEALVTEEDDFIHEAWILMSMKHEHIVRLVGVSCTAKPFFLVTEYVAMGNLRDCLRENKLPMDGLDTLFDVCIQITSALYYLECKQFVLHRDIAARNCLVASDMCIKLADFGRAVYVSDGCYQAPKCEKIPIKWAAPEVLAESAYSTKSDVWALGVLYWEILSWGQRPYPDLSAEQAAVYITEGGRLDKPTGCSADLYAMMKSCWRHDPDERPTVSALYDRMKSKSSIYYGPVQARHSAGSGDVSVKGTPLPPKPRPSNSSSPRKSGTLQSMTAEEMSRDLLDSMREDVLVQRDLMATSSSETSLVSSTGTGHIKDDMSRSDKIRKSLRKMINVKQKRKTSKLDMSRDSTSRASGQVYM